MLVPRWLSLGSRSAMAPLVQFDLGDVACELSEPPFGTNMAFRKSMFEKYGGFRTDLGPRPGSEIRSEDSEFGGRLLAAGERLRYEPSALGCKQRQKDRNETAVPRLRIAHQTDANIRQSGLSSGTTYRSRRTHALTTCTLSS